MIKSLLYARVIAEDGCTRLRDAGLVLRREEKTEERKRKECPLLKSCMKGCLSGLCSTKCEVYLEAIISLVPFQAPQL